MSTAAAPAAPRPATLRARLRRWWVARLPRTDLWTLGQRNIYILPTRAGALFAFTLVLMLVASINYQLNLGYVLTFLLAGAGIVSMHVTHNTLRGLTLQLRTPAPGFAGDAVTLEAVLTSPGHARHGVGLAFDGDDDEPVASWVDVPAGGQASARLAFVPPRRGRHAVPTLRVETRFPFGLFRAWSLWRPRAEVLAWPKPERPAAPLPPPQPRVGEPLAGARAERGEFDGVRAYQRGDALKQIVWKKAARTGELVSRDARTPASRELWLDWHAAGPGDAEAKLSRLAAWVLAADQAGFDHALRLPGVELPPGQGDVHRRRQLEALALW